MSDTKWTPGPWVRCDAEMNKGASSHGWFVKVAPCRVISVEGRTSDEADANAHLIAAAPELYEALVRVVAIADRKTQEFDAARAALAKARGES